MKAEAAGLIMVVAVVSGLWTALPAHAEGDPRGRIEIEDAWARPTLGQSRTGAIYMKIANAGEEADRLIAVETPIADRAELHAHIVEGDVMKMRRLEAVEIPAGGKAALAPGERHVMLFGLARPLEEGDRFGLTLTFEKAGPVEVEVAVRSATGGHRRSMPGYRRRY